MDNPQHSAPAKAIRTMQHIGNAIRQRRKSRRLTLEQLAAAIGCTKGYLSIVETGKRLPSQHLLQKLEHALDIPDGALRRAGEWESTPEAVKRELAALHEENAAARALARTLRDTNLGGLAEDASVKPLLERLETLNSAAGGSAVRDAAGSLDTEMGPDRDAARNGDASRRSAPVRDDRGGARGRGSWPPSEPKPPTLRAVGGGVPLIGASDSGYPVAFTDLGYPSRVAEEFVSVPGITDPDAFAARVIGDAMEPEYRAGDIVVFSPLLDPEAGADCFVRFGGGDVPVFRRVFVEGAEGSGGFSRHCAARGKGGSGNGGATVDAVGGVRGGAGGGRRGGGGGARGVVRLQPLNPRYAPRLVEWGEICGIYRAVCTVRRIFGPGTPV